MPSPSAIRRAVRTASLAVACVLFAACDKSGSSATAPDSGGHHGSAVGAVTISNGKDMEARLAAAKGISDLGIRGKALAEVAAIAGAAGDGSAAMEAIRGITDLGVRDKAASAAAVALARSGQRDTAVQIAKLISDLGVRDAALAKVAKE